MKYLKRIIKILFGESDVLTIDRERLVEIRLITNEMLQRNGELRDAVTEISKLSEELSFNEIFIREVGKASAYMDFTIKSDGTFVLANDRFLELIALFTSASFVTTDELLNSYTCSGGNCDSFIGLFKDDIPEGQDTHVYTCKCEPIDINRQYRIKKVRLRGSRNKDIGMLVLIDDITDRVKELECILSISKDDDITKSATKLLNNITT